MSSLLHLARVKVMWFIVCTYWKLSIEKVLYIWSAELKNKQTKKWVQPLYTGTVYINEYVCHGILFLKSMNFNIICFQPFNLKEMEWIMSDPSLFAFPSLYFLSHQQGKPLTNNFWKLEITFGIEVLFPNSFL